MKHKTFRPRQTLHKEGLTKRGHSRPGGAPPATTNGLTTAKEQKKSPKPENMKLKAIIPAAFAIVLMSAACTANKAGTTAEENNAGASLAGTYDIVTVALNDTALVNAVDIDDAYGPIRMVFTDTTYSAKTNCNTIFGEYTRTGGKVTLKDGGMTQMACPDVTMEQLMVTVLPQITDVEFVSDTLVNLTSANSPARITLRPVK